MQNRSNSSFLLLLMLLGIFLCAPHESDARVYSIGPGKTYASIGDMPWNRLAPGDTVEIYWQPQPYHEKLMISCRGTEAQPIRITGVPGPDGQLPILDGENATSSPQFVYHYAPTQDRGLVIVTPREGQRWGYKPGYLHIENLEMRNACVPNTFTAANGGSRNYTPNAAALFIERGEHIVVHHCTIDGSGNGLFVASGSSEEMQSRDILVENCDIYGNGNVGRDREHNVYTEAIGMVFQYNHLGSPRDGAGGNNLKDRSAGTVIRYNWIENGAHMLDLVEPEESVAITARDASYHETYVQGNVFVNGPGSRGSAYLIHYGGDNGNESTYRKGTLHFDHNTVIVQCDQTGPDARWRTAVFQLETNDESADVQDNVFFCQPNTSGSPATELDLLNAAGSAKFGVNWISPGWQPSRAGDQFKGTITGKENLISNNKNDPGFVDLPANDVRLSPAASHPDLGVPKNPDVVAYFLNGHYRSEVHLHKPTVSRAHALIWHLKGRKVALMRRVAPIAAILFAAVLLLADGRRKRSGRSRRF